MAIQTPDARVAAAFVEVTVTAINAGLLGEASLALAGAVALRPTLVELNLLAGLIEIEGGHYDKGMAVLAPALDSAAVGGRARVLTAKCLFAVGDPGWASAAADVLDGPADAESRAMASRLLAVAGLAPLAHWHADTQDCGAAAVPAHRAA